MLPLAPLARSLSVGPSAVAAVVDGALWERSVRRSKTTKTELKKTHMNDRFECCDDVQPCMYRHGRARDLPEIHRHLGPKRQQLSG
jgi:hypothetical protein